MSTYSPKHNANPNHNPNPNPNPNPFIVISLSFCLLLVYSEPFVAVSEWMVCNQGVFHVVSWVAAHQCWISWI